MGRRDGKRTDIGTREVDGVDYAITLSEDGRFCAIYDDSEVTSETLDKLLASLRTKMRKRKVATKAALPVSVLGGRWGGYGSHRDKGKFRHGIVTGIHGSNGNILFKQDGEKGVEQLSSYSGDGLLFRRLTAEEIAEYTLLDETLDKAQKAAEVWKKEHGINVKAELAKLEQAAGIAPEER